MIRDTFDYEGKPKEDVWVSIGNPYCTAGKLCLDSTSDGVRTIPAVEWQEQTEFKLKILGGSQFRIVISDLATDRNPRTIPCRFYDLYWVYNTLKVYVKKDPVGGTSFLGGATAYAPLEVRVVQSGNEIRVYRKGKTWTGEEMTETLLTSDTNMFKGQKTVVYIFGGSATVDYFESTSMSERMIETTLGAVAGPLIGIVIFIVVVSILRAVTKRLMEWRIT